MNAGEGRPRRWLAVAATAALSIFGGCDRAVDAAGAAREAIDRIGFEAGERAPEVLRELGARTAEEPALRSSACRTRRAAAARDRMGPARRSSLGSGTSSAGRCQVETPWRLCSPPR